MENKGKKKTKLCCGVAILLVATLLVGCAGLDSTLSNIKGKLVGNKYNITFYDNYGEEFLKMKGDKIDIEGNEISEMGYISQPITPYHLSLQLQLMDLK